MVVAGVGCLGGGSPLPWCLVVSGRAPLRLVECGRVAVWGPASLMDVEGGAEVDLTVKGGERHPE